MDAAEQTRQALATRVSEAITRFGVAGDVRVQGESLFLIGHGPSVRVALNRTLEEWPFLPEDLRDKRCQELARALVGERRASLPPAAKRRRSSNLLPDWLLPVAIIGVAAAGIYLAYRTIGPGREAAPVMSVTPDPVGQLEREREQRERRVCEATRTRVMQGATVGPTDVDGWYVEISLLRRPGAPALLRDPGLSAFITVAPGASSGKFVWPGAAELSRLEGPGTEVHVSDASLTKAGAVAQPGIVLSFRGRYVLPYFKSAERSAYVRAAAAMAERLDASHGGVYARCSHLSSHQLGSWFLGPTPSAAAGSLVYLMSGFADPPALAPGLFGDGGTRDEQLFKRIQQASDQLDRAKIATLIGPHGGMLSGKPGERTIVSFPFGDGNRAGRSGRSLALAAGIALER